MLPKENRLKKSTDFEKVYRGKGLRDQFFSLKFRSNNLNITRIGVVVGGKVSQKSTERNKLKRRARDALKKLLPKIKKGIDVVIISLPRSKELNFEEVEKNLRDLFKKVKLLND